MTKLDEFFTPGSKAYEHPWIRYLDELQPASVAVEVYRQDEFLGAKPTKLFIHVKKSDGQADTKETTWDDDLNAALVHRGIRAVSEANESLRFALVLRRGFRKIESRYGDGFFNSVLVDLIRTGPLAGFPRVEDVLKDMHSNGPYAESSAHVDCSEAIVREIRQTAADLSGPMQYGQEQAEQILAGAVAQYLDDRFTVSDRRRLGWT